MNHGSEDKVHRQTFVSPRGKSNCSCRNTPLLDIRSEVNEESKKKEDLLVSGKLAL